ncbi:hypothetical protein BDQ12DRAFT_692246 [Crucibulum laeve]|uniref:DUF6534 domain-containing protein n=1 Tax=Crucibulum laeve TaxID=68775 RepID=A0A5C3LIK8_9AGAR|nr:hypothetical protein BDQ12DRAFT_692246 [Crucibulum laeve]
MSALPPVIPIPPNIESVTAPLLLGALFDYALYGVLSLQIYIYFLSFPDDRPAIKWLVRVIYVLETVQVCLSAADIYFWFGTGYGNVLQLDKPHISPFDTPIMCAVVSLIVQLWFCYRIWILDNSMVWVSGIIASCSLTQAIGAIIGGAKGHIAGRFSEAHSFIWAVYIWLIGSAVADVIIAGTMAYLLLRARTDNQKHTNTVLMRLVRLIVETNSLTAGMAIFALIIFLAAPNNNWFTCPTMVISKLYSNTLLVSFNNRIFLRVGDNSQHGSGRSGVSARVPQSHSSGSVVPINGRGRPAGEPYKIHTFRDSESGGDLHLDDIQHHGSKA